VVRGIERLDEKARVAILVNSEASGPLAPRARAFAQGLAPEFAVELLWRESRRPDSVVRFLRELQRVRPEVLYLLDIGYSAVLATSLYRAFKRCRLVVDTGDALAELFWTTGRVGAFGRLMVRAYEGAVLRGAQHVIVRGSGLRRYTSDLGTKRVDVVPDGVDTAAFRPMEVPALRKSLRTEGHLSIGIMSSLNWSPRLQWGPGCELIEVLALLRHLPVCGVVVGDGPAREILERKAADRGVRERISFLGHIAYEALPAYIAAMDVCLSTQTNNWVGRVRTTGKLPLFLACGRFVLASRVGEAARVLPDEMLVDYREGFDPTYGERLAGRVERIVREPQLLNLGEQSRKIAEAEFDYGVLIPKVAKVLWSVLEPTTSRG
jgi:glycosyltransferase involved in cell wall biosynthesis